MLVGLVALFSFLFFGGAAEIFYVDDLAKGIKKYVIEKDRKKEILSEIKNTKTLFKEFEKGRKEDFKTFKQLYSDKQTSVEELESFFSVLEQNRDRFQNQIIDQRLVIFSRITQEEWIQIIEISETAVDKRLEKYAKKESGKMGSFKKTKTLINNQIGSDKKKKNLLMDLTELEKAIHSVETYLLSINASHNAILANKDSEKADLLSISTDEKKERKNLTASLIQFHSITKENLSDDEWAVVMKTLLKELNMSSR